MFQSKCCTQSRPSVRGRVVRIHRLVVDIWFLAMLSGFCLFLIVFFLPETSRLIAGNGSISTRWHHRTIWSLLHQWHSKKPSNTDEETLPKRKFHIPNPITCLKLLFNRSTSLIVLVNGVFYMAYGCIQASMSSLFIQLYGFNKLEAGLIYLPFGAGCALASFFSGKLFYVISPGLDLV